MTTNITLTREEAQQVLYTLETLNKDGWILADFEDDVYKAIETLRARIAQPEPSVESEKKYYKQTVGGKMDTVPAKGGLISEHSVEPPRFPTMLRKMWSGSEVQAWIDEHYTAPQRVYCSCGDGIVPDDGALCGTCVSLKDAVKQEPVAWHEPGSYSNVTVHKKWAEENGWLPLYKEKNT